jgi:hypothetical protein
MPTIDDSELDPIDERAVPLVLAVGRLVLGAAALEKVLLVDIITRHFHLDGGWRDEFMAELDDLEKRPAGKLLGRLRDLGIPADLAERIGHVIRRRNQVVHHLMEDVKVTIALQIGDGMEDAVTDIDRIAIDCQQVVNELTLVAFPNMEAALGMTLPELAERIGQLDLAAIEDPQLRQQVEFARVLRDALTWEPESESE